MSYVSRQLYCQSGGDSLGHRNNGLAPSAVIAVQMKLPAIVDRNRAGNNAPVNNSQPRDHTDWHLAGTTGECNAQYCGAEDSGELELVRLRNVQTGDHGYRQQEDKYIKGEGDNPYSKTPWQQKVQQMQPSCRHSLPGLT